MKFLFLFFLINLLFSQDNTNENSDSLFININSSLSKITYADDICKSSVYIMNPNIERSQSKKMAKVLAKNLKKNKKNLKIYKSYTQGSCTNLECIQNEIGNTKANHAFVIRNSVNAISDDKGIVMRNLLYDFNSAKLRPEAEIELLTILSLMENNPNLEVTEAGSHFALGLTFLNVSVLIALLYQLRTGFNGVLITMGLVWHIMFISVSYTHLTLPTSDLV